MRRRFIALLAAALAASCAPAGAQERGGVARRADAILFYGQSNAGAGGTARPVLTQPLAPERAFTFRSFRQTYGSQVVAAERFTGLQPLADAPQLAPFPQTAMGIALADIGTAGGERDSRFFFHTVWYGGQPLNAFGPGTTAWQSLMNAASRVPDVADADIAALVFIQGEAGPYGRATYRDALRPLLDQALDGLSGAARQERRPFAIIAQSALPAVAKSTPTGVEMAQWDVARHAADVALAGPMYHLPFVDNIHQNAEGRMMLGEMLALAYRHTRRTGRMFQPLQPIDARRAGQAIDIRFRLPEGSGPLAIDRDWVPALPHHGFAYHGEGEARIVAVAITGPDAIRITLDREPDGRGEIRYAQGQDVAEGWSAARGQIMAPSGVRSPFAARGHKVPAEIRHYAIRFSLPVD